MQSTWPSFDFAAIVERFPAVGVMLNLITSVRPVRNFRPSGVPSTAGTVGMPSRVMQIYVLRMSARKDMPGPARKFSSANTAVSVLVMNLNAWSVWMKNAKAEPTITVLFVILRV